MSILADSQIRELSVPPTFVITTNIPQQGNQFIYILPKSTESFTHLAEEELKQIINNNIKFNLKTEHIVGIVNYRKLTEEEHAQFKPMISPYSEVSVKTLPDGKKIPSWGSSSYGYDIRIGRNFKLFGKPLGNPSDSPIIDICDFANTENDIIIEFNDVDFIEIPPHGFALGHSLEHINVPNDITIVCMGKSTIARSGLHMCITPCEASWSGYITIELENMTDYPIRLHSGIGIAQLLFLKGEVPCDVSYSDRQGKYQNQASVPVTPKL